MDEPEGEREPVVVLQDGGEPARRRIDLGLGCFEDPPLRELDGAVGERRRVIGRH
ncbi:hypothetical protein [Microbacterium tenebrionis]|uniref:hypothetical protein n=1 Tax=Microbacterium tenebrionis TaxID=2830665 RepID=UPI003F6461EE